MPDEFGDPMTLFGIVSDYLSPTWWPNQVLNDTIGCNPLEFVTDYLVGDREGFATWLAADWQGQAADGAAHYWPTSRRRCRLVITTTRLSRRSRPVLGRRGSCSECAWAGRSVLEHQRVARDVPAGKTDLRAAMLGHRYEEALNNEMRTFSTWYRGLSDDERAE